jgi:hypothetical protein
VRVTLRAATRSKIEHATRTLADEFDAVPHDFIAAELEATAMRLLERARFDDYVPLLAHRYVRETLRNRPPARGFAEAA